MRTLAATRHFTGYAGGSSDEVESERILRTMDVRPARRILVSSSHKLVGLMAETGGWSLLPPTNLWCGRMFLENLVIEPVQASVRRRRMWFVGDRRSAAEAVMLTARRRRRSLRRRYSRRLKKRRTDSRHTPCSSSTERGNEKVNKTPPRRLASEAFVQVPEYCGNDVRVRMEKAPGHRGEEPSARRTEPFITS